MAEEVEDPVREFAARLRKLRADAGGPSLNCLVDLTRAGELGGMRVEPLARSTISDKLRGNSMAPYQEWVMSFVTACSTYARSKGIVLSRDRTDLGGWQRAHTEMLDAVAEASIRGQRAQAARTQKARLGASAVGGQQATTAVRTLRPTTSTVADWNPFHLGVHRAITIETTPGHALPDLTPYVKRRHDQELRQLLINPKQNLMVILVGGSSTGKSRSAWEAIRTVLPGWLLARPANAQDLIQCCQPGVLPPNTVLWLNETQSYLDGRDGPEAAAALLLRMETNGPIVAVGTMWPHFWERFTLRPPATEHDAHRQARDLLATARAIPVPEGFGDDPADLRLLEQLAQHDQRLAVAVQAAGDACKVIQVLAGGEQLVERYSFAATVNPASWAVVTAAMDARRLGHGAPIPPAFLRDAAPGYLTAHQRADQPRDWFTDALAHATAEVRGISALTAVRSAPGIGEADGYELADYLAQHARTARDNDLPPASLWDALAAYASDADDSYQVAWRAAARHLYRHGVILARRAAEAGSPQAVHQVATMLARAGYTEEAAQWDNRDGAWRGWQRDACSALEILAEQDEEELSRRTAQGFADSAVERAVLLIEVGRYSDAEGWLRYAELTCADPNIDWVFADLLERTGRDEMAEKYWGWLAADGEIDAMRRLAKLQIRLGRSDDAEHWLRKAANTKDTFYAVAFAMRELAELLRRTGRPSEAECWLQRAADAGEIRTKCELLQQAGRRDEVEQLLRHELEQGNRLAEPVLLERLEQSGRSDEADRLRRFGIDPGGKTARPWRLDESPQLA